MGRISSIFCFFYFFFPFFTISCWSTSQEKTLLVNRTFLIASSHKASSPSMRALRKVIEAYNRENEDKNNFLKAELFLHNDLKNQVIRQLKVGNFDDLPSLILSYPNLVSSLAKYDKALLLKINGVSYVKPSFSFFEKNIVGLEKGKKWLYSIGSSTDVMAINSSMLAFVIKNIKLLGGKVNKKDKQFFDFIEKKGQADEKYLSSVFGLPTKKKLILDKVRRYNISKTKLSTLNGIIGFARLIKHIFPNLKTKIIGFDAPLNTIFTTLFSRLGNRYENFIFNNKTDSDKSESLINPQIFEPKTNLFRELKAIFKLFVDAVNENLVRFPKSEGDYGSNDFINHELIFSIASTAGFPFYFSKKINDPSSLELKELSVISAPHRIDISDKLSAIYLRGPMFFGVKHNNLKDEAVIDFLKWIQKTKKWKYQDDTGKIIEINSSPLNYFSLESGYIPLNDNFLREKLPKNKEEDIFFKTGFEDFKLINEDTKGTIAAFREPVSDQTEVIINAFFEAFNKSFYKKGADFATFLKIIKLATKIN